MTDNNSEKFPLSENVMMGYVKSIIPKLDSEAKCRSTDVFEPSDETTQETRDPGSVSETSRRSVSCSEMSSEPKVKIRSPSRRVSVGVDNPRHTIHSPDENRGSQMGWALPRIDQFTKMRTLNIPSIDMNSLSLSQMDNDCRDISRVLVLYTGGTIGMKKVAGVYQPEPNYFSRTLRRLHMFNDPNFKFHDDSFTGDRPFVMPVSKEGVRVVFIVCEYSPLLDSCDMTMDDWVRVASDIQQEYANYTGFVVLHGTDTMAYTASALSFILENLGKPVVVTGSQIPIFEARSDGRDNLLGALIVAGHYCIPEVTIYFHNKLLRGNRCSKVSTNHFDAFDSPNYPPLADFGTEVDVHIDRIFRNMKIRKFKVESNLCPNVAVLRMFPSITLETIQAFLKPPIQGVILQTFGAGNMSMNRQDILDAFHTATKSGLVIVNITQCFRGAVKAIYATGAALEKVGVIAGEDMTPEAALTKLSYVLGKQGLSVHRQRDKMASNIRGELTPHRGPGQVPSMSLIGRLTEALDLNSDEDARAMRDHLIPSVMCAAAKEGNLKALVRAFDALGHYQVADYDLRTPLHVAASEGNTDMVEHLLKHGALIHKMDRFGFTPLANAVHFNRPDVVRLLLKGGAHLAMTDRQIATELNQAAATHNITLLRSFKLAGATLKESDHDGRTCLHVAANLGYLDVVTYLLENGADPTHENAKAQTALDEAIITHRTEIIELINRKLHRPSPDPSQRDSEYFSPELTSESTASMDPKQTTPTVKPKSHFYIPDIPRFKKDRLVIKSFISPPIIPEEKSSTVRDNVLVMCRPKLEFNNNIRERKAGAYVPPKFL